MSPWVQMAQAKQNIEQGQAATANLQAQNPGIVADSKEKARIAARNQLAQDLAAKHSVDNPDGSKTLDMPSYKKALAANGLVDEAFGISGTELNQQAQALQNAYHQGMNPILIAEGKKKLSDSVYAEAANTLSQIKDDAERKQYAAKYVPMAIQMYGLNPDDPRNMTLLKGDTNGIMAVANTATPLERGQLAVSQGQLGLAQGQQKYEFAKGAFTPEGRDANSTQSKNAREMLKAKGVDVPANASLFDMMQVPGYAEVLNTELQSNVVPAQVRAGGVTTAAEVGSAMKSYDEAIRNADSITSKFGNNKIGQLATKVGTKFLGSPEYTALMTAVQTHNMNFPGDQITDVDNLTPVQISAKLKAGQKQLANKKVGAEALASSKSFPGAAQQNLPTTGNVRVKSPNGTPGVVKAADLKKALDKGYTMIPAGE
jgi:hypothetical protein